MHVEGCGHPALDLTVVAAERSDARDVEAMHAFAIADPVLHLARRGVRQGSREARDHVVSIVGVNGLQRTLFHERDLARKSRELRPAIVDPVESAVCVTGPDDLRERVRQPAVVPDVTMSRTLRLDGCLFHSRYHPPCCGDSRVGPAGDQAREHCREFRYSSEPVHPSG